MQIFNVYPKRDQEKIKIDSLKGELYSWVVMIRRQTLIYKDKDHSITTKIRYLFQYQSARSQHWFKLDPD